MIKMDFKEELIGKCGIYCGACRLYILGKCKGCLTAHIINAHTICAYYQCVKNKGMKNCGECKEFPCKIHYGKWAVDSRKFLEWRKQEIIKK